jgi:hypothetical protein
MLWFVETHNSEGATISEYPAILFTVFLMYSAIRPNTTFGKLEKVLCSREETRRWVWGSRKAAEEEARGSTK